MLNERCLHLLGNEKYLLLQWISDSQHLISCSSRLVLTQGLRLHYLIRNKILRKTVFTGHGQRRIPYIALNFQYNPWSFSQRFGHYRWVRIHKVYFHTLLLPTFSWSEKFEYIAMLRIYWIWKICLSLSEQHSTIGL